MIQIEDIMTRHVTTLDEQASVLDARRIMNTEGIRHIPVVDADNKLLGIFTQRDLLAAMDSTEADLPREAREARESALKIRDVMTRKVSTATRQVSLREAATFLQNKKVGCLPIVEDGEILGIITDSDFIAVAINLLEQIENTEPLTVESDL